jgi:hypothetical protein
MSAADSLILSDLHAQRTVPRVVSDFPKLLTAEPF